MKKHLIYIVDDEPINRMILSKGLEKDLHCIKEAGSGSELFKLMEDDIPDLILLDIMMPGKDGITVCNELKENPQTNEIPIVFISAISDKSQIHKGLVLGAVDYVTKPFDLYEVRLRIKQHLKNYDVYKEAKRINMNIKKDIMSARKLQFNLLPESNISFNDKFDFFFEYYPCESLGGDFLDIFYLNEDKIMFYIVDVSGHGITSSLVTIFVKEFFNRYRIEKQQDVIPSNVLRELNKSIIKMNFLDQYLTIFLGIIDTNTGELDWVSAGPNTIPFIINEDLSIENLSNSSLAVGWFEGINWEDKKTKLNKNSILVLYSDAATEIVNTNGDQLGVEGFKKILEQNNFYEVLDFTRVIQDLLDYSTNLSFDDDLTLVGIKHK